MALSKRDLIDVVSRRCDMKIVDTRDCIETFLSVIAEALELGEDVRLGHGFGTFKTKLHKEKTFINPQTKEEMSVGAVWRVKFRPSDRLKYRVADTI